MRLGSIDTNYTLQYTSYAGHSHSIINKPMKPNCDAGLEIADSANTMKNTMFKNN